MSGGDIEDEGSEARDTLRSAELGGMLAQRGLESFARRRIWFPEQVRSA